MAVVSVTTALTLRGGGTVGRWTCNYYSGECFKTDPLSKSFKFCLTALLQTKFLGQIVRLPGRFGVLFYLRLFVFISEVAWKKDDPRCHIHLPDSLLGLRVRSFIVKPRPHTRVGACYKVACYKVSPCDFVACYDFVACDFVASAYMCMWTRLYVE